MESILRANLKSSSLLRHKRWVVCVSVSYQWLSLSQKLILPPLPQTLAIYRFIIFQFVIDALLQKQTSSHLHCCDMKLWVVCVNSRKSVADIEVVHVYGEWGPLNNQLETYMFKFHGVYNKAMLEIQ